MNARRDRARTAGPRGSRRSAASRATGAVAATSAWPRSARPCGRATGAGRGRASSGSCRRTSGSRRPIDLTRAIEAGSCPERRLRELSPVVFAAAGEGDAVARSIVDRLADELVAMAGGDDPAPRPDPARPRRRAGRRRLQRPRRWLRGAHRGRGARGRTRAPRSADPTLRRSSARRSSASTGWRCVRADRARGRGTAARGPPRVGAGERVAGRRSVAASDPASLAHAFRPAPGGRPLVAAPARADDRPRPDDHARRLRGAGDLDGHADRRRTSSAASSSTAGSSPRSSSAR